MRPDINEFLAFLSQRYGINTTDLKKKDSFLNLGVDSLSLFSLVGDIEENYHIKLDADDLTEIDSVSKLYASICAVSTSGGQY